VTNYPILRGPGLSGVRLTSFGLRLINIPDPSLLGFGLRLTSLGLLFFNFTQTIHLVSCSVTSFGIRFFKISRAINLVSCFGDLSWEPFLQLTVQVYLDLFFGSSILTSVF
jgi:hypothetical protein